MCLVTEHREPLTAEEDTVVYIILRPNLRSIYKGFVYELGKSYKTVLDPRNIGSGNVWSADEITSSYYGWKSVGWKFSNLLAISKGFHSYQNYQRAIEQLDELETLVQCTIPKGCIYYKDSTGLLLSNQLRVDKIIEE